MTLSRFRTFVGIALDRNNGQLSAATAIGATSLPVTNINYVTTDPLLASGANYSAIIIDGPLTEVVALSGNLSAGAVPCAATANAHNMFTYVVFQLTASIGPTAYIPLETFEFDDTYEQLYDTSNVGSMVRTRGAQAGKRFATFDMSGGFFVDTIGYILGGIFGSEDYTSGTPDLHAFGTLNVALTGSTLTAGQPVRYLIYNYDANNCRIFSGRFSDVMLTIDPKSLIKHTSKFMARASGVVATPTQSFSAITPTPAWTTYARIGGVNVGTILTSEVSFTRLETEDIPTLSTSQDPWDVWVGPLQIKGKFSLIFDDDTQLNNYYNESQPTVKFITVDGTGATEQGLTTQMTACNYEKAMPKQQGKAYVTQDIEFEGLGNGTDTTTSGGGAGTGANGYIGAGTATLANNQAGASHYT